MKSLLIYIKMMPRALSLSAATVILGLLYLAGCARSYNPDIKRGSEYSYRSGYPEVRFSAVGFLNEDNKGQIRLAADIVYGSLIYKKSKTSDTLRAEGSIDIQILDKDNPKNIIQSRNYALQIARTDPDIVYNQDVYTFQKSIPVPPGSYKINFIFTDKNSDKQIQRTAQASIPDPAGNTTDLTNIMMQAKENGSGASWFPITTYDVTARTDSISFVFQATNNRSEEPLTVEAKLIRFESDTSVARFMYSNNYSSSSIQYKGIDYDERTVIQSTQRKLLQPGSVLIEFKFPTQPRGNYRFEVHSNKPSQDKELFKARDFGVKSRNYPSVKSPRELARPMTYLMDKKAYEKLIAIQNPDSLKKAIDEFWLKNIGDVEKAKSVIKMYYERVEEANKQFSNFKEGWKTDTGMMYVLFGPPWYVEQHLDKMMWSYSYNRSDPEYNFLFVQPKLKSEFYPFQNYLLQRSNQYFNIQYQQRQLWLTGLILTRNL